MMQGHEVTVVDNFFTGRKRNVEHWIGHENFELLNHDVVNPLYIEGRCISLLTVNFRQNVEFFCLYFIFFNCIVISVDQIYHLASPASPPHYMYNPIKTIKTNTLGTINMLGRFYVFYKSLIESYLYNWISYQFTNNFAGLAKRVRARLLLASTSEVYGGKQKY